MMDFIIKYWLEVLFGAILLFLSFGLKQLKKEFQEQADLKEGLIAILHDRLFQSGMFFLNKGEISLTELNNIDEMYKAYHKLGGNGTGTEIYERVKELKLNK